MLDNMKVQLPSDPASRMRILRAMSSLMKLPKIEAKAIMARRLKSVQAAVQGGGDDAVEGTQQDRQHNR